MTITFFGHSNTPQAVYPHLKSLLSQLIETQSATRFYVGHQGTFDRVVIGALTQLQQQYPHIQCCIVLAYLPGKSTDALNGLDTIYPEELTQVPYRFAISKRNQWMIDQADTVITFVQHNFGNANRFQEMAERKGKHIINLADLLPANHILP